GRRPLALPTRGALTEGFPPLGVDLIPAGGIRETFLEGDARAPAQLAADPGRVEQVAAVVAGPILDVGLQRGREAQDGQDAVGDLLDALLDAGAQVVGLPDLTLV